MLRQKVAQQTPNSRQQCEDQQVGWNQCMSGSEQRYIDAEIITPVGNGEDRDGPNRAMRK